MTAPRIPSGDRDWPKAALCDVIRYIVEHHHEYLRTELPSLSRTVANISSMLSGRHSSTILKLNRLFTQLTEEVEGHMKKEETVLFPEIIRLEEAALGVREFGRPAFGSFRNPILMLEQDHTRTMEMLREIRTLTEEYQLNDRDCEMFRFLCRGLQALEMDLLAHIDLESRILFPRAIQMENGWKVG